jgi:hypothetical protein
MTASPHSVLSRATAADIRLDPFPHLLIENALDPELFDTLSREFPPVEVVTRGTELKNGKTGINCIDIVDNEAMSAAWREFCAYHSSREFFSDVTALFGDTIRTLYPFLEEDLGRPLDALEPKRRIMSERKAGHRQDDIVLDCQIMLDETSDPRICRGPHVDAVEELYAALLYFRHPDDDSDGGELCVVRARDPQRTYPAPDAIRVRHHPAEIDEADVEIVAKVPYRANTLIMFINSPASLHTVTVRSATPLMRRHVNIIGETYALKRGGLFRVLQPGDPVEPPKPPTLTERLLRKLGVGR